MLGDEGEGRGKALLPLGRCHVVLFRQNDLIGHRRSIEKIEHLDVDWFGAMAAIDEKENAR